jgi:hypothetical protein
VAKLATMAVVGLASVAVWQLEPVVGPWLPLALLAAVVGVAAGFTSPPWEHLAVVATGASVVVLLWSYAGQPTALPATPLWAYVGVGCLAAASAAVGGTVGAAIGARRSVRMPDRRPGAGHRAVV